MRLSPTPSALPPVCPGAAAATSGSRAAARKLAVLTFTALLLAGTVRPSAASPHASGAPAVADTLRVTLAAPEGGSVAEGSEASFEVSVAGSTSDGAVTVRYSVSGTAKPGTDYRTLSGEVTVAKGENSARIVLSALDDEILDDGETVVLALTGASGATTVVVDSAPATATIADHGTVTVEITPMNDTLPEGAAWNSTVTLSSAVAARVSVGWRTSDGTAVAGSDYEGAVGSVVFEPGERSKTISVKTMEDDESEPVEMFYVALDATAAAAATAGGAGAWAGAGGGVRVDPQQRFGFIECSVEFPDGPISRAVAENAPAGTRVGAPVTAATESIAFYSLSGGSGRFAIDDVSGQITTTEPLDHEARSAYVVRVSVSDDCGARAATNVTINVENVNEAPMANAGDDQNVEASVGVTLSGTSTDLDGDDATWGAPSHDFAWVQTTGPDPDGGLKNANTATATFKAPSVTKTTDLVFELTVTDGGGLSDTDAVTVTVKPPDNKPPVFEQESYSFTTDDTVSVKAAVGRVRATDPEGGPVKYSLSNSSYFEIDESTGWIAVKAQPPEGTYSLTAKAKDSFDAEDTAEVTIKVNKVVPPNKPPKFEQESYSFTTDDTVSVGAKVGRVRATDPEGGSVKYSLSNSSYFEIDESTGWIAVKTQPPEGTYSLTATAEDSVKAEGTAAVAIKVNKVIPPNKPPEFERKSYSFTTDDTVSVDAKVGRVRATDPEGGRVKYSLSTSSYFDIDQSTGWISVKKRPPEGSYSLTATAKDSVDAEGTAAVAIKVNKVVPPNKAPKFERKSYSFTTDDTVSVGAKVGRVRATDPEGGRVKYSLSTSSYFDIDQSTGWISVKKRPPEGSYSLTATAKDSVDAEGTAAVAIKVNKVIPPNKPPEFERKSYSFTTDDTVSVDAKVGRVRATDPEGGRVKYSLSTSSYFDIDQSTGWISVKKRPPEGSYSLTATAKDSVDAEGTAAVAIKVNKVVPPNKAPKFERKSYSFTTDDTVSVDAKVGRVRATDPEGGRVKYSLSTSSYFDNRPVHGVDLGQDTAA